MLNRFVQVVLPTSACDDDALPATWNDFLGVCKVVAQVFKFLNSVAGFLTGLVSQRLSQLLVISDDPALITKLQAVDQFNLLAATVPFFLQFSFQSW